MLERRTKIVATLGPATDAPGVLDRLVAAGMDCARLNCSHGTHEDLRRRAAEVRAAAAARRPADRRCSFDLQGPKLRLSSATRSSARSSPARRSTFSGDARRPSTRTASSSTSTSFAAARAPSARRSSSATACRGSRSSASDRATVVARAVSPGPLPPRKGINVTYARPELPAITEKDMADLARRRGARAPTSSRCRSCARRRHRAARASCCASVGSPARVDRQDREGRGLRAPRRDHRGRPTA